MNLNLAELFIKFCLVGGSGVLVDFGATFLCKEKLKLNKYLSNSVGFILATISNYIINRIWTFNDSESKIAPQFLCFLAIASVGLLINNGILFLIHEKLGLNFYLSKLLAIGVVTFWNFFMNYFFNFNTTHSI